MWRSPAIASGDGRAHCRGSEWGSTRDRPDRQALAFVSAATGLPGGSFDLVHARTLLLNVGNPDGVVTEMVRLARPGGIVALLQGAVDAYDRSGKDFDIGRRIARMLQDAGLGDVHVRATARVTRAGEYYQSPSSGRLGGEQDDRLG